jgi:hypothetical protein
MGPPPYERRLSERPQDREEFDGWLSGILFRSRPGGDYRIPWIFASPARRRELRRDWERIVRSHAGRIYELGRRP